MNSRDEAARLVALAGNPNVGKSTVFNALTGLRQHTGNWSGKTVACAQGHFRTARHACLLADLPGTYSLLAHSAEECVARDFLCFGGAEAVVVVCDATCLERNLNLVLQTLELTPRVLVCVNLLDEARRRGVQVDLDALAKRLGVPVVGVVARQRRSLAALTAALDELLDGAQTQPAVVRYPAPVERALAALEPPLSGTLAGKIPARWMALQLLAGDAALLRRADEFLGGALSRDAALARALQAARAELAAQGVDAARLQDCIVSALVGTAEALCRGVVRVPPAAGARDRRLDRVLTGRRTAVPVMLALLALVLWLTIVGANAPSQWLAAALFWLQDRLTALLQALGAPDWLHGALILGVYRTTAWVVSVMLPPMAIFFPLFALLEDAGYLPRVAYNLDCPFQRCRACGKQALTMLMGLGCNAVGVTGCRIIDSERERRLAVLTNSLMPCNGRFPTLLALLTMFFAGTAGGAAALRAALLLTGMILLGVGLTFGVTRLLSVTVLRGAPSSFALELPPYRRPQPGRVFVHGVLDRTRTVLSRAVRVAAPAGLLIWLLANLPAGDSSVLQWCAALLEPLARPLGLDGALLLAFLLGLPANEIVLPLLLMIYLAQGSLTELGTLASLREILAAHGWTWRTAGSAALFTLLHWPCSTTLQTVYRETGSGRDTALAAAIPTALGVGACLLFTAVTGLFA